MVTPYYERDGIVIYHGDCLDVLREITAGSVELDAVVTDVPYASGARSEAGKKTSGAMVRGERWKSKPIENDQMTTAGFVWFLREMCYASRELLVDGGAFVTFIDWRQWPHLVGAVESTNLRVNGMGVWDKQSMGLGQGFRSQHELFLFASKGTATVHDHGVGNVLRFRRDSNSLHPSPKPVEIMAQILRVVTPDGGMVLDPCMGAGSTLRAAADLGRRAIGIEVEERYCEIAAERLRQKTLF